MKRSFNIIKRIMLWQFNLPCFELNGGKVLKNQITKAMIATLITIATSSVSLVNPVVVNAEEMEGISLEDIQEDITETEDEEFHFPVAGASAVIFEALRSLDDIEVKANDVTIVQTPEEVPEHIIPVSDAEVKFMEQIVAAETFSYWSVEEVLPIAQIIVNRYYSDEFPNSINDILSQKGQFETYSNGRYKTVEVSDAVKIAVEEALCGEQVLPQDALFFCTESYYNASGKYGWFGTLTKVTQVDNTIFFC